MNKYFVISILILISVIVVGILSVLNTVTSIEPIVSCEPIENARPLCGWQNPEDMVSLPNGQHVIVSEYGAQDGGKAGTLSLLDLKTETREVLFEGGTTRGPGVWGADDCVDAPGEEFSPHGIHLSRRADGTWQLLAVQHGGRESVEMFEVIELAEGWGLAWRGCVNAPKESMLNDVVASPNGGFLVTHMMNKRSGMLPQLFEYMKNSLFGIESGYVLSWQPEEGFSPLASSQGAVANGIEISSDGETIFVNYSGNGELRRINRHQDQIEATNTNLPPLDNITWSIDGQLLLAGARADALSMMGCMNLESGTCPGAFAIFSADPLTLESKSIYEGGPTTPSGAGTVGLEVSDGSLLIGTFAGDRIVRVMPDQEATK